MHEVHLGFCENRPLQCQKTYRCLRHNSTAQMTKPMPSRRVAMQKTIPGMSGPVTRMEVGPSAPPMTPSVAAGVIRQVSSVPTAAPRQTTAARTSTRIPAKTAGRGRPLRGSASGACPVDSACPAGAFSASCGVPLNSDTEQPKIRLSARRLAVLGREAPVSQS